MLYDQPYLRSEQVEEQKLTVLALNSSVTVLLEFLKILEWLIINSTMVRNQLFDIDFRKSESSTSDGQCLVLFAASDDRTLQEDKLGLLAKTLSVFSIVNDLKRPLNFNLVYQITNKKKYFGVPEIAKSLLDQIVK